MPPPGTKPRTVQVKANIDIYLVQRHNNKAERLLSTRKALVARRRLDTKSKAIWPGLSSS